MNADDTIVALATPPGRSGVAVVRVSGARAFDLASHLTGRVVNASQAGTFFFSHFRLNATHLDSGLVLVFASPHSYTGEDVVEFQCHGGTIAPRRILEACFQLGARLAHRGEFTERAFLNGRLDLTAAEAVLNLIDAKTVRAADEALERLSPHVTQKLNALYDEALELSSQLEYALDISEDDFGTMGTHASLTESLLTRLEKLEQQIAHALQTAREGELLHRGATVVLLGAPNVGKSSLLNALVGSERAIVSPTAGTTRDLIETWIELDGWPIRLVDTAGLRETEESIEAEGVLRARSCAETADVRVHLVAPDGEDSVSPASKQDLVVYSKCDLLSTRVPAQVSVSARTGEGLDELKRVIVQCLDAQANHPDEATGADISTRQKEFLVRAQVSLEHAQHELKRSGDYVLAANHMRTASQAFAHMLGKVYTEDLLSALFSRFCVGK